MDDQSVMKIAAGVLHYRHWPGVRATLDTLREQTRPPEHVVVIDHASGDGSAQHIREAYPEMEVMEITSNRGPIAGMNHVLRETLARPVDAVFILPDDAPLAPDVLERLAERLEERPSLGGVCALNVYPGEQGQTIIHHGGYIDRRTWHIKWSAEPGDVAAWTDRAPHLVDWIEAAGMLFRATAARQAGPFNESFFHRDGTAEFTIRMHSLGWELECVPAAVVHTDVGKDSTYLNTRNHLEIVRLHAPTRFLARELVRVCYLVVRDVLSLRRRPTRDTWYRLKGLIDFVRRHWGPAPERVARAA
jgi:GT2 family glycosyltransferase